MLLSCYMAPGNLLVQVFNHHFHRYFIKYAITVLIDILYADVIHLVYTFMFIFIWTVFTVGAVNFKLTKF